MWAKCVPRAYAPNARPKCVAYHGCSPRLPAPSARPECAQSTRPKCSECMPGVCASGVPQDGPSRNMCCLTLRHAQAQVLSDSRWPSKPRRDEGGARGCLWEVDGVARVEPQVRSTGGWLKHRPGNPWSWIASRVPGSGLGLAEPTWRTEAGPLHRGLPQLPSIGAALADPIPNSAKPVAISVERTPGLAESTQQLADPTPKFAEQDPLLVESTPCLGEANPTWPLLSQLRPRRPPL